MKYERTPVTNISVRQGQSGFFQCVLRDQDGALVPSTALTRLTLTLYNISPNKYDGNIVNEREAVDVLGPGKTGLAGVTFPVVGGVEHMRWDWTSADAPILDRASEGEIHIATFDRAWGPGGLGRADSFDVRFEVGRVHKL